MTNYKREMEITDKHTKLVPKRKMLERLQFSKNLQIALRAHALIHNEMEENEIQGMFLDAVCRDEFKEALMRADDHNKSALMARDFTVGKFMRISPDKHGYETGKTYFLKIVIKDGSILITPSIGYDAEELVFTSFLSFSREFTPKSL